MKTRILLLPALLLAPLAIGQAGESKSPQPNILFILTDDKY